MFMLNSYSNCCGTVSAGGGGLYRLQLNKGNGVSGKLLMQHSWKIDIFESCSKSFLELEIFFILGVIACSSKSALQAMYGVFLPCDLKRHAVCQF